MVAARGFASNRGRRSARALALLATGLGAAPMLAIGGLSGSSQLARRRIADRMTRATGDKNMRTIGLCGVLAIALAALPAHAEEQLSHGRFAGVTLYRPEGPVKSVVLFLSGDGGWNLGVV